MKLETYSEATLLITNGLKRAKTIDASSATECIELVASVGLALGRKIRNETPDHLKEQVSQEFIDLFNELFEASTKMAIENSFEEIERKKN